MKNQINVVSKLVLTFLSGLMILALLPNTYAQSYYGDRDNRNDRRDSGVVIYSDCDFRGTSRRLSVGEFQNLGIVDFDNDSLSSIRVPEGLEVTLYQDDRFRGDYTRVDRDVVCFDKTWNDKVSSMRVAEVNLSRGETRYRTNDSVRNDRDQRGSNYRNNSRLGSDLDRPVRNNRSSDITSNRAVSNQFSQNRDISGQCFSYKAYTNGGTGGLRFHGHDGFEQFSSSAKTGRICHSGALVMEVSKKDVSTNVIVEIQGKRFGFAANEKEDVLLNTWYRKKVQLRVN